MITVIGRTMWDMTFAVRDIPHRGEMIGAELVQENPGGCAANTAANVAALGEPVNLISRLGEDSVANAVRASTESFPTLRPVWLPAHSQTGVCIVMRTPDGERTMLASKYSGENQDEPEDLTYLTAPVLADTSLLWVDISSPALRASYAAATDCRRGLPLNHFQQELDAGRSWQLVVGSEADKDRPELSELKQMGVELCVITEGARGGSYSEFGGEWQRYDSHPVDEVVDSCGAGDAFLGGLLVGLHRGVGLDRSLALATRQGAQIVAHSGSWPLGTAA